MAEDASSRARKRSARRSSPLIADHSSKYISHANDSGSLAEGSDHRQYIEGDRSTMQRCKGFHRLTLYPFEDLMAIACEPEPVTVAPEGPTAFRSLANVNAPLVNTLPG